MDMWHIQFALDIIYSMPVEPSNQLSEVFDFMTLLGPDIISYEVL